MDEAEGAAVTDAAFMHDDGGSAVAGASAHDDGGSAVAGATAPVSPLPEDDGDDADNDDDMSAAAAAPSGEHDTAAAATAAACAEDGGSIAVDSEQERQLAESAAARSPLRPDGGFDAESANGGAQPAADELFEHDKDDVCGMHDTDKIGKRAIGDLTRKKNGRVIDPFPEGQALVKKVHEQVITVLMRARVRALAGGRRAHAHTGITTLVRAHATIMQRPPPWPLTL